MGAIHHYESGLNSTFYVGTCVKTVKENLSMGSNMLCIARLLVATSRKVEKGMFVRLFGDVCSDKQMTAQT